MSEERYKPGQLVPDSGIVREAGPRGGQRDNYATVVQGEPFPPTSGKGNTWVYEKKTPKPNR